MSFSSLRMIVQRLYIVSAFYTSCRLGGGSAPTGPDDQLSSGGVQISLL